MGRANTHLCIKKWNMLQVEMIFSIQIEATSIWTYLNPQTQIFCSNLDNYICRLFLEKCILKYIFE